jgi:hypothetical protein
VFLVAGDLNIPAADLSTANSNPFFFSRATQFTLTVDRVSKQCTLQGYLGVGAAFTGGWEIQVIQIPNVYLPKIDQSRYVMGTGTLHSTGATKVIPQPVSFYLDSPSVDTESTMFKFRFGPPAAWAAGKFNEFFTNASWFY